MVAYVLLLYILVIYLAVPFAFGLALWRGLSDRAHWERLSERFGLTRAQFPVRPLWIHAVSVGEVQAAAILIRALQSTYPQIPLLMTTGTVTGAARVRALFDDTVRHCYLPYDLPGAVRRFLTRTNPRAAIVLETELWPVLFRACISRQVPVTFVSARVSEKSVSRYRKLGSLFTFVLARSAVAAQSTADAERFRALGATRVEVSGNIKFDLRIAPETATAGKALRNVLGADRPVWTAGSTHEGEEVAALDAHEHVLQKMPNAVLVLVPRHPQRFEAVRSLLVSRGVSFVTRSSGASLEAGDTVLLVDTLGELLSFYAASDVAFVGGSIAPVGGHNLLEPAALGIPVIAGPYNFNAPDIAKLFVERDAISIVTNGEELGQAVGGLLADTSRRQESGARAQGLLEDNRGALEKVLQVIEREAGVPPP